MAKTTLHRLLDAAAAATGTEVAWARLFFPYGPREHPDRLVPTVARSALAGVPAECTSGTQRRDYVFVDDAAAAMAALVDSPLTGAVNIGSGAAIPVAELAEAVARAAGHPELLRLGALATPPGEPDELAADVGRLLDAVGSVPSTPLEDGARRTVDWWRAQPPAEAAR